MQKILLLLAVVTVMGHGIIPHIHHHDEIHASLYESIEEEHHHDEENSKDEHHNILSFAQLDDTYIPANKVIKNVQVHVEFVPVLTAIVFTDNFTISTKTDFGWYKEYPPPDNKNFVLSFRGPPVV